MEVQVGLAPLARVAVSVSLTLQANGRLQRPVAMGSAHLGTIPGPPIARCVTWGEHLPPPSLSAFACETGCFRSLPPGSGTWGVGTSTLGALHLGSGPSPPCLLHGTGAWAPQPPARL